MDDAEGSQAVIKALNGKIQMLEGENTILADTIVEHEMRAEDHKLRLAEMRRECSEKLDAQDKVHRAAMTESRAVESRLRKEVRTYKTEWQSAEDRLKATVRRAEADEESLVEEFEEELSHREEHKKAFIQLAHRIKDNVMERTRKLQLQDVHANLQRSHVSPTVSAQNETLAFSVSTSVASATRPASAIQASAYDTPQIAEETADSIKSMPQKEQLREIPPQMEASLRNIFSLVDLDRDDSVSLMDWMRATQYDDRLSRLVPDPPSLFHNADQISFSAFIDYFIDAGLLN